MEVFWSSAIIQLSLIRKNLNQIAMWNTEMHILQIGIGAESMTSTEILKKTQSIVTMDCTISAFP